MVIQKPFIKFKDGQAFLISVVIDEVSNREKEFYFSVSEEYGDYLCTEVADAFLVAMLVPALFSGQDIRIDAPISELLKYQIDNSLLFTLSHVYDKPPIKILPASIIDPAYHPTAVATGFSGGVDSFTTVLEHISKDCPESLRLTHLTLFNVGSYGNDEENTQKSFKNDAQRAEKFSRENGLPLVLLNSNISKAYDVDDMIYGFTPRSKVSIISGVLALQKLIKVYFIASSNTIDDIELDKWYQDSYETLMASFLTTSSTRIIISNPDLTKVQKIIRIANHKIVQSNLYVCLADIINEIGTIKIEKGVKPNCSQCYKCLNAMVILDILGLLDKYQDRFDLDKYNQTKAKYLRHIIKSASRQRTYRDIYELMIERKYVLTGRVLRIFLYKKYKDSIISFSVRFTRYIRLKYIYPPITFIRSLNKKNESYS
jgi:hypothetical protein